MFSTVEYIDKLVWEIERISIAASELKMDASFIELLRSSLIGALNRSNSLYRKHINLDENFYWVHAIEDISINKEPSKLVSSLYGAFVITDMIVDQVRIKGVESSLMTDINLNKAQCFNIEGRERSQAETTYYHILRDRYFSVIKFSIIEEKLRREFSQIDEDAVRRHFLEIQEDKEKFEREWGETKEKLVEEIRENNTLLYELKNDTSFAALYRGFDNYAQRIIEGRRGAVLEKWGIVVGMVLVLGSGVGLKILYPQNWLVLISVAAGFGLLSVLLKVCLKRIDQFDQIKAKVEHKLAVSAFYENRIGEIDSKEERQLAQTEYYRFLFSKMETRDWNAPDVMESLSALIREVKK